MLTELTAMRKYLETDISSKLIWAKTYDEPIGFVQIPYLRNRLNETLAKFHISPRIRRKLCHSLTEILSNLIEHPAKKASFIDLKVYKSEEYIYFCLRDDSSPFIDFYKKLAESRLLFTSSLPATSGRGLGLVAEQHKNTLYLTKNETDDGYNHFCIFEKRPRHQSAKQLHSLTAHRKKRVCLRFSPNIRNMKPYQIAG
ncbi:MAG: ATP-binding protein [Pseudomonadota bacterium]